MKKSLLIAGLILSGIFGRHYTAAQDMAYKMPPKEISDIALAKLPPRVSVSADGRWLLLLDAAPFLSVEELAQPEYKLAGTRVNGLFGPSRREGFSGARLLDVRTKKEYPVAGLPEGANILEAEWSPGSSGLAFVVKEKDGYYLWIAPVAERTAKKLSNRRLNRTGGLRACWIDEETLILPAVPADAGSLPGAPPVPAGPLVQFSDGKAAPARTYQDLLKSPYDEALFDYLFTSQLVRFSPGGETEVGRPAIYTQLSLSPDKRFLLAATVDRPYSYTVSMRSFPQTTAVYTVDGTPVKELNRRPVLPDGMGYDTASPFPRNYGWRPDLPATLCWVEAQDEGNPRTNKVPFMDIVYQLDAPFDGEKAQLARTELRFQGIRWGDGDFALISEASRRTRRIKTYSFAPGRPDRQPELLFDLSTDDSYADPGNPLTVYNRYGQRVLYTGKNHSELLMISQGASPEGDMPCLSRYTIRTRKSEVVWRCKAPYYETVVEVIDPAGLQFITSRESASEPANYFLRTVKPEKSEALTSFATPYPQLEGMKVEKMQYRRADGLGLTATLYTPPGYDRERDGRLPVLMWAYPREYRSAGDAAQVRGSKYRFTTINYGSPVFWVTRGFAVMNNVEMPIVGSEGTEPNDNFIEQLVSNAEAAAGAIYDLGVGDTSRMAVGGHSYGGFMTANLLTHTSLYKAGIARSGAYNRTLTPFGFQAETRTYWEAPEVYYAMSPFNYADKLSGALLLVHGEADNNTGTFPIQSERLFAAIQGHGGVARLVLLPYESHAYSAKENILHLLYEEDAWLEKHVKTASPAAAPNPPKAAMTVESLAGWKRITEKAISADGKWVSAKLEPWKGDATIHVYNRKGEETASFGTARKSEFAAPHHLLVTQTAPLEETEALKAKKTPEDRMPMDKLIIYGLENGRKEEIDSLRSYKLSGNAGLIAWQRGRKTDSTLYVRSPDGTQPDSFPRVENFLFAKKSNTLYYVTAGGEGVKAGLYAYRPEKGEQSLLWEGDGVFRQAVADETGSKLAFLYCPDKDSVQTAFALYLSEDCNPARRIAERSDAFVPSQWVISEHGKISFTKNAKRLFFGIAPQPKQKDTVMPAESRPDVQVWNWDEKVQYTQQDYNRAEDLKKTYPVVYNLAGNKFVPLTTSALTTLQPPENDEAPVALLSNTGPYETERMWEGTSRADVYAVNLETGDRQLIEKGTVARIRLSPLGKYAYWYNPQDSSWYSHAIAGKKTYRLTDPASFTAWDEDNDVPNHPNAHGSAGWTAGDRSLLLYDRFDIWQFDPTAAIAPVNLTVDGRKSNTAYRRIKLDDEETAIAPEEPQLLSGFNRTTRGYGYYSAQFTSPARPHALIAGDYKLSVPVKAKEADALIYTSETYSKYPDVLLSDLTFKQSVRLTQGIRQQDAFVWGTAELISWISLDGKRLEGVVYKPDGFDPKKKYPVIVNFYERNSETLHSYRMPEVNRSSVDYHFYNSNGYIVFNPDIVYRDGYPGESCFNSVMSGVSALIAKGYVNEKAIAAQGHSWGGYQDAYLATRTNLFAAIESGAPVVNMFSAYGGIRWGSGLNRSFQYEHGQSRIGASIWESPLRYLENSPLFDLDKVQTPILIMANDKDGHVPWYQGIEFFVALKRLQKPAWLLNYTGEPHWPTRMANKIDFQKRMFQFFEHYLNNRPMPKWMSEGVPAVARDFELGY